MRCPNCASLDTQVKDSAADGRFLRHPPPARLPRCNFRFTTFERVQLRELAVIKRNGRRVPFDRDKLLRSVQIALRKRPVEPERIEQAVSKIVRELESQGESEVSSETIGEMVMEALRALDDVAYVRFASVYRNFREAKDFEALARRVVERGRRRPSAREEVGEQARQGNSAQRERHDAEHRQADMRGGARPYGGSVGRRCDPGEPQNRSGCQIVGQQPHDEGLAAGAMAVVAGEPAGHADGQQSSAGNPRDDHACGGINGRAREAQAGARRRCQQGKAGQNLEDRGDDQQALDHLNARSPLML